MLATQQSGLAPSEQMDLLKKEFYDTRSKEMRFSIFFFLVLSFGSNIVSILMSDKFQDHFSDFNMSANIGCDVIILCLNMVPYFNLNLAFTNLSFTILLIKLMTTLMIIEVESFMDDQTFADVGKPFIIHVMSIVVMITFYMIYTDQRVKWQKYSGYGLLVYFSYSAQSVFYH